MYNDGTRHLVTAGGDDSYDTSTWIYDLDSGLDIWRPGPLLQYDRSFSVPYKNTFLVVGGEQNFNPNTYSDQIWQFNDDPFDEKWILRDERFSTAGLWKTPILVPDDYATC